MRIEDLPFGPVEPFTLLGFRAGREDPDLDYAGYGWARVDAIEVADAEGGVRALNDALLVVAHTPDEAEPGPLVLEFWTEWSGESVAVQIGLEPFLEHHVRPLLGRESAVVLVVCNPHGEDVPRPPWLGPRSWVFARGDVTAWLYGGRTFRLEAERWIIQPELRCP